MVAFISGNPHFLLSLRGKEEPGCLAGMVSSTLDMSQTPNLYGGGGFTETKQGPAYLEGAGSQKRREACGTSSASLFS